MRLWNIMHAHKIAFLMAILIGLIYVSHHFFISQTLDAEQSIYYPITLESYFDEASFYAHRAHAAYLGQWIVGDIHTIEHEGGPSMMSLLNPVVLGGLGRITGSMKSGFIASDFLFPAIIFLLLYAICHELTRRRLASIFFSALFLFVPKLGVSLPPLSSIHLHTIKELILPFQYGQSILHFTHFEEPKITFVFFAFAVWGIIRAITQKSLPWTIPAGIGFGLLFYTYLYDWATIVTALLLLILIFVFWFKDYENAKRVVRILIIGLIVSIPYWINLMMLYSLAQGSDIAARAGRELGHALRIAFVWKSYIRIAVLIPLLGLFGLGTDTARKQKTALIAALLGVYALVVNAQVITGFNIHPDHWYRVQFLPIMLAVFLFLLAFYDRIIQHRAMIAGKWAAVIFLIYFLSGQAYYQYIVGSDIVYAKNFTVPSARADAYQWLVAHATKKSVIGARSFQINREIPLFTKHKIYLPHGLLTLASDQELWDRFFFINALFNVTPDVFNEQLKKGETAYYLFEERFASQKFNSSFFGSQRKFPNNMIDDYTKRYAQYISASRVPAPSFQLDYLMTDEDEQISETIMPSAIVYDKAGVTIYEIRQ